MEQESISRLQSMNWSVDALNTSLLEDYCNAIYSHFSHDGAFKRVLFKLIETHRSQMIADVVWIVEGVLVLTGSRYRPCIHSIRRVLIMQC